MSISGNGTITASMDSPGLIWTSYNGYFGDTSTTSSSINDNVNHFSTASTLTGTNGAYRGTSSDFTSTSTATNGNIVASTIALFSIQFLGYFLAPQSGTYTWSITCDDKSYLWIGPNAKTGYTINNAIFFDSWAVQSSPVNVVLNAGVYYPIRIQYGEEGGPDSFSMYFTLPGSVTAIYNGAGYYFNDGTLLDNVLLNPSTVVARMTSFMENRGLIWTSYNNYLNFTSTQTLNGINGVYSGMSSDFTNTSTATNGNFADGVGERFSIEWVGYFLAPITGPYTWVPRSDDASYFWMGPTAKSGYTTGNALIYNSYDTQNNANIGLTAGVYYPIRIQYAEEVYGNSFSMYFTLPGSIIPIYNGAGYFFNDGTLYDWRLISFNSVTNSTSSQFYINVKNASTIGSVDNTSVFTLTNTGVTVVSDASRGNVLYFNGSSWINTNCLSLATQNGDPSTHTRCFWVNLASTSAYNNTVGTLSKPMNFNQTNYMNFSYNYPTVGYTTDTGNTVTTSSWNFYALTYDGTTAKLYKNGNLVKTDTLGYTTAYETIQIGAYNGTNFLNGYLDNIRIYFNALTQAQIQAIYNYELAVPNQYYNEAIPVTITNNNFTTPGGINNFTVLIISGSTTAYGWTFNNSTEGCYFNYYYRLATTNAWLVYYSFPSQYNYVITFQFYLVTGTMYMSQSITFPQDGTYVLTLWAAPFGQNLYNGVQTLSAFIDNTQVITDWSGVGSSGVVTASLLTSSAFTVTAGTHTLRIQSYSGATNTTNTTIVVTGININNINSTKYLPYLSNGLTNYYSFDSGITVANYASGNAVSDITLYGGAVISSSVFKVGSGSLYLNAANSQYAQISSSALNITTNGVSFVFWFNFNSSNGYWARLFDFGNGPGSSNILYAPVSSVLSVNNTLTVFQPTVDNNYADNKWHHFCWTIAYTSLTVENNTWKLYIDGVVVYTTAVGNYPNIITRTNNYIGKSNWDGDPYATGYVDDFRIYNSVVSSSEVLSLIASQKQSNTSIIDNLIPGKKPWGIYDATLWNSSTNTLPEARGNGRDVTNPAGTVTYGTGSGNGAAASVPYISGTTATQLLWPSGSIPTNFTICSITRYTGGTYGRILSSYTGNWLHGHWGGNRGVAYYEGWKTNQTTAGTLTNWLVMCGNNGTSIANSILVDSVAKGTATGGTGGGTYTMSINMYHPTELSDWAFTYTVIYDTVLTDAEMYTVSNVLLSYLSTGTMDNSPLSAISILLASRIAVSNDGYSVYKFNSSQVFSYSSNTSVVIYYLVVGGGGAGGRNIGGGGGGGQVSYGSYTLPSTNGSIVSCSVTVGNGGAVFSGVANDANNNGKSSNFVINGTTIVTALGGGFGGNAINTTPPSINGYNGGGSYTSTTYSTLGGNAGGAGQQNAGGGGGAGGVGGAASSGGGGGAGGIGLVCPTNIKGISTYLGNNIFWGGGGGGGGSQFASNRVGGRGGKGGGGGGGYNPALFSGQTSTTSYMPTDPYGNSDITGNPASTTALTGHTGGENTGGGGGGAYHGTGNPSSAGGSGIVMLAFPGFTNE